MIYIVQLKQVHKVFVSCPCLPARMGVYLSRVFRCMHGSLHSVCVCVCLFPAQLLSIVMSKLIRWVFQCTGGDRLAPNESIWDCLKVRVSVCMCERVFSIESQCVQYIWMISLCVCVLNGKTLLYVRKNNPPCECSYGEMTLCLQTVHSLNLPTCF